MAKNNDVTLVIGISERVDEGPGRGTLYNSILTFGPDGALLNHHRKLMPTYTERMVWGAGDADGLRAVSVGDARIGALVCWEHWMPLARQALHDLHDMLRVLDVIVVDVDSLFAHETMGWLDELRQALRPRTNRLRWARPAA